VYPHATAAERTVWENIRAYVQNSRHFIIVFDGAGATPATWCQLGYCPSGVQIRNIPPAYYEISVPFVEALG
jgi:hypothetical protein